LNSANAGKRMHTLKFALVHFLQCAICVDCGSICLQHFMWRCGISCNQLIRIVKEMLWL